MHRKALGKGLEALIPGATAGADVLEVPKAGIREIPISEIGPNPHQPRTRFDDEGLRDLASSIKASGVIQPVLVRKAADGGYQLVAGERRFRASQLAGLAFIPAIVKDIDDRSMLELALVENLQREDLNAIDEAKGYRSLSTELGMTHEQISERVGKNRSAVTNALRLLALPVEVQDMVSRGTLTAGHARALLSLPATGDQLAAARYVQNKGFSVRRTEAFVNRRIRKTHSRSRMSRSPDVASIEERLQQRFATKVTIHPGRKGGRVEFQYYSPDDLERLLESWSVV